MLVDLLYQKLLNNQQNKLEESKITREKLDRGKHGY